MCCPLRASLTPPVRPLIPPRASLAQVAIGRSQIAPNNMGQIAPKGADLLRTEGSYELRDSAERKRILEQGRHWADHILEGPISWIMSAIYIAGTVTYGSTPISAIYTNSVGGPNITHTVNADGSFTYHVEGRGWEGYCIGAADAIIYIFLPIWTTWLLRILQRRPLGHRVAGRSLLIGDIPWVSQVRAYRTGA